MLLVCLLIQLAFEVNFEEIKEPGFLRRKKKKKKKEPGGSSVHDMLYVQLTQMYLTDSADLDNWK